LLRYDPKTGVFIRLVRTSQRGPVGETVGYLSGNGYIKIGLLNRLYFAHRLAWLWMTGGWPSKIDHRNGDGTDNRWSNLRLAVGSINNENLHRAHRDNQTGLLGVSPAEGKFKAGIQVNGLSRRLGTFSTPEEAHAVYLKAKRALHSGCTI